jgi:hypothetical protein
MAGGETNAAARITGGPATAAQTIDAVPDAAPSRLFEGAGGGDTSRLLQEHAQSPKTEPLTKEELFTPFERAIPSMGGVGDFLAEQIGIVPGNRDRILAEANARRREEADQIFIRGYQIFNAATDKVAKTKGLMNRLAVADSEGKILDNVIGPGTGAQLKATVMDFREIAGDLGEAVQADPALEAVLTMAATTGDYADLQRYVGTEHHINRLKGHYDRKFGPVMTQLVTGGIAQMEERARLDPGGKEAAALAAVRKDDGKIDPKEYFNFINPLLTEEFKFNPAGSRDEQIVARVFEDGAEVIEGFTSNGNAEARRQDVHRGAQKIVTLRDKETLELVPMETNNPRFSPAIRSGRYEIASTGKEAEKDPIVAAKRVEDLTAKIRKRVLANMGIEETQLGLRNTKTANFAKITEEQLNQINAEVSRQVNLTSI